MRKALTSILLLLGMSLMAGAQGIPFIRNYTAREYGGHNQNFSVTMGDDGVVYVANFEGLIYYDNADWRMLHTPSATRVTCVFRDTRGTIWTGGYNYIGYITTTPNGSPSLQSIDINKKFHGEVQRLWEKNGQIYFLVSDKSVYTIHHNNVIWAAGETPPKNSYPSLVSNPRVNQCLQLEDGLQAIATNGDGVIITDRKGRELFRVTEDNGLCSNNVSLITYNGHGLIWGATDNGIFCVAFPSVYTRMTSSEGLHGEVLSIASLESQVYAGTQNGLFRMSGKSFVSIPAIRHACWQLATQGNTLLAATADGVYRVSPSGDVRQLTTANTMSLLTDGDGFYSGEADGVYHNSGNGARGKVSDVEKVVSICRDRQGTLWVKNLYGKIWESGQGNSFRQLNSRQEENLTTLVEYQDRVFPVEVNDAKPFPYPAFSFDDGEILWLTDNKGKALYAWKDTVKDARMSYLTYPLMDFSVRAMMRDKEMLWMGGDKGLNIISYTHREPAERVMPRLHIRSILLNSDSVLWGGFGAPPEMLPKLSSNDRRLTFNFSIDFPSLLLNTQYRTRLNNANWSAWSFDTQEEFPSLSPGSHAFHVQARDAFGRVTNVITVSFYVEYPLYARWYTILLYLLLAGVALYLLVRFRLHRLEKEKHKLESIVQERTAEVVKQKDEIEEKSKSLETALRDLSEAQHKLVRQEKMVTAGKLTQGLIDRILNPLNYINNFAKLSEGLVRDVLANVEDERERMEADNYEDTVEVLGMLKGNLEKVSEHGSNTTRTLKAMEEMLKDRSGGITQLDIMALIRQNEEMLKKYYEKDINEHHIKIVFNYSEKVIMVNANAEQLSKTLMSLLGNAVYAVVKKTQRTQFTPEVDLTVNLKDEEVEILIRDNGIGIEDTIIHKIFDPFFTTKTTGEASGVGLYLSREIIQNYGGDITVKSQKDEYTEFSIILPTLK